MTMRWGRRLGCLVAGAGVVVGVVAGVPAGVAQGCPAGHVNNEYTGQCYLEGNAPTINGVPCVASNLGLCQSFRQNQQPPKKPYTAIG
ncbi:hypothetical protein [Mycobacterium sp. ENV421]|uniref:hypothetical protein n=1 Tax=Mycobacterium sp. ENV421 TaxID=1213407 RepID=UPI001157F64C|nr:hypothetical protein [Mycobacterium sp. ENV421]